MKKHKISFIHFVLNQLTDAFLLIAKIGIIILLIELLWGFPFNTNTNEFSIKQMVLATLISYLLGVLCKAIAFKLEQRDSNKTLVKKD